MGLEIKHAPSSVVRVLSQGLSTSMEPHVRTSPLLHIRKTLQYYAHFGGFPLSPTSEDFVDFRFSVKELMKIVLTFLLKVRNLMIPRFLILNNEFRSFPAPSRDTSSDLVRIGPQLDLERPRRPLRFLRPLLSRPRRPTNPQRGHLLLHLWFRISLRFTQSRNIRSLRKVGKHFCPVKQ